MCDDTQEQGCLEDQALSAALFFIEDKSAFLEDQGYPEIAVHYLYKMIRGLEKFDLEFSEEKRPKISRRFTDYFDAFISENHDQFEAPKALPPVRKRVVNLYVYRLASESIQVDLVDKKGVKEKYKGTLESFVNLYGPASGMEYEWIYSDLIKMDAPYYDRNYISQEGLQEMANLYEAAIELSTEDESWDRDLLLTFNQVLKMLNRKTLINIKKES